MAAEHSERDWIPSHPIEVWSEETVRETLKKYGIQPESLKKDYFKGKEPNGKDILHLVGKLNKLKKISQKCKEALKKIISDHQGTVFNDPVHGHIELHPLMVKFIDTPQFQRLRYIKQQGGAYYVYPGASHNRFEHSIGVCHLAGELVENLRRKQQELRITDEDVLCVKLAGLCHDLGHGPFSHLFESVVKDFGKKDWKHEHQTIRMFRFLIDKNGLDEDMKKYNLVEYDKKFIEAMVLGLEPKTVPIKRHHGRDQSKRFLFEIVANKRNGVDVDKFDYFARDCLHLGTPNGFNFRRYMELAHVIEVDGQRQICIRDKEVYNVYELFHTRHMIHIRASQHKTCNIIELMIKDALVKAKDYFTITVPGTTKEDTREVTLANATDKNNEGAYTLLTDQVLQQIMSFHDPNNDLKEAKDILRRIETRRLYRFVGQRMTLTEETPAKLLENMLKHRTNQIPNQDDIIMWPVKFDYGMGEDNPIDHMNFFTKQDPNNGQKVHKDEVSRILPSTFKDVQIQVFCRKDDEACFQEAYSCFLKWCNEEKGQATPKDGKSQYLGKRKRSKDGDKNKGKNVKLNE